MTKVELHGSIMTRCFADEPRLQNLQSEVTSPSSPRIIVQLPAREVSNLKKLGSRHFRRQIMVLDERYCGRFPVAENQAYAYVVMHSYRAMDAGHPFYLKVARRLLGPDVFDVYMNNNSCQLDNRQVTNIATRLQAGLT